MKINFKTCVFVSLVLLLSACGGGEPEQTDTEERKTVELQAMRITAPQQTESEIDLSQLLQSLDEIAELERSGSWLQGMALTESAIRENIGDYAGAVAAAYKELAFAYGRGLIQKEDIEQGVLNLLSLENDDVILSAANAVLAFLREHWTEASDGLALLFDEDEEPDGFGRWMMLVCALEKNSKDRRAGAAYRAIRARYAQFPEYWYRGARAFTGSIAAEFAENCINSSPSGPFAVECRNILASYTGLKTEDGLSIKTRREIEEIISMSINTGNPQFLDPLLPLIGLPDNPYTVYAVGALRALTPVPVFRDYFDSQASVSAGRLGERLSYISRG